MRNHKYLTQEIMHGASIESGETDVKHGVGIAQQVHCGTFDGVSVSDRQLLSVL